MEIVRITTIISGLVLIMVFICSSAIAADNQSVQYFNEGINYFHLGRYTDAVTSFDKAIAINPNDAVVWNNRGLAQYYLKNYMGAVVSFDKAVVINQDYDEAWYNRGSALYSLEKYSDAIVSFDKAITIKPNYADAWNNRGFALSALGLYTDAVASFDKALAINPNAAGVWNNRGLAQSHLKNYTEAVASYDKALAINPNLADVWYNRGEALNELGRYTEAVASYDGALAINPYDTEAWNNRGLAQSHLKNYTEAVASYDKALAINPNLADVWYNRGKALNKLGQYTDAIASFDKALAINPDDAEAKQNREIAFNLQAQSFSDLNTSITSNTGRRTSRSSSGSFNLLVCLGGGFILGLYCIYTGLKKYPLLQKIEDTPTSKVSSVSVGLVELSGKARFIEPEKSPVNDTACVYWQVIVWHYCRRGRSMAWEEFYSTESKKPFYIEDETGKMLVSPEGAQIEITLASQYEGHIVDKGLLRHVYPLIDGRVLKFIESLDEDLKQKFLACKNEGFRVSEFIIRQNDPLYVMGSATPSEGAFSAEKQDALIIRKGTSDTTLYISTTRESTIVGNLSSSVHWYIFGGLALSGICLCLILLLLGV